MTKEEHKELTINSILAQLSINGKILYVSYIGFDCTNEKMQVWDKNMKLLAQHSVPIGNKPDNEQFQIMKEFAKHLQNKINEILQMFSEKNESKENIEILKNKN